MTIHPAETSGEVYRLGTGDEYFLIENRGPGGAFDRSLPERGLAVFHVDRTVKLGGQEGQFVNRILDCVNCDPWHPYIRLLQADGLFEIERNQRFGPGDLFRPGSSLRPDTRGSGVSALNEVNSTNLYSGASAGLRARRRAACSTTARIEVTLDAPETGQCDERLCADGEGCAPVDLWRAPAQATGCTAAGGSAAGAGAATS